MPRTLAAFVLVAAVSLAAAGAVLARWHAGQGVRAPVAVAHAHYAFDPSDDRALAAYATDIFFGQVLARAGAIGAPTTAPRQELPQTQFAVQVLDVVKGDAAGVVTVNQVGGIDARSGQTMVLAGDAPLRPGSRALFLTVRVRERGWYQIAAGGHGRLAADDPEQRDALLARFDPAASDARASASEPRASSLNASQQDAETIDFITFNGAVYLAASYFAANGAATPIAAGDLGPAVGEVVTNWVDADATLASPNEPCSWHSPDGAAPRLAPGDRMYALRGYATTFRLAARHDDEIVGYQVWCNDDAEVGADLFDIYDRVERISVTEDLSELSGWAVIDDRATLFSLVGMLLAGAVIPEEFASTAPVTHQMIFHLDDGATFRASAAPGELLWGLGAVAVPVEFTETLARAWTEYRQEGANRSGQ